MFPGPTELRLIGCSMELTWTQKIQNQVHRHQKPTRWHSNQRKFHTWWVESFVVLVQHQPFQFYRFALLQWRSDLNNIQEKNESQQNQNLWWILLQGRPSHVSSSTSVSPGKKHYGSQDPRSTIAKKEERSGRLDIGINLPITLTMNILWKASLQQAAQSGMMTVLDLLKSGKLILRHTSDRGDLMKLLGEWYEHFDLVPLTRKLFTTEPRNPLWTRRNTSWQIGATWYRFSRRGMVSTIRHWKRWSRIGIVSRIKIIRESGEWSGAEKTKTIFDDCYRKWRKTFYDLENVYGCNNGNQQHSWERITQDNCVTPLWTRQISHSNKCSTYLRNWCLSKMRSQDWKQLVWRIIHGNICH